MLVVVTGGPCSGKTTLVEAFGERGHPTVPEAAIQVIAELVREMGNEAQKAWRTDHRAAFQLRILEMQMRREEEVRSASGDEVVFLDRSRLDGIAYCRNFGEETPRELLEAARDARYDAVFLLDTLKHVPDRGASGRTSDRDASVAIRDRIAEVYAEYGFDPIFLPESTRNGRVEEVLASLAG